MVFCYKLRANLLPFFPANSEMTSFKSISLCLCTCITDSEVNLASDIALRSGVVILFMLLKLCSATNVDTGYVKSVSLDGYINSRVKFLGWQSPEVLIIRNTWQSVIITESLNSHSFSISSCCSVILSVPMAK